MRIQNFHLPSCRSAPPGMGRRQKNSRSRAPEPLPTHGALRRAPAFRIRLTEGSLASLSNRPLCRWRRTTLPSTSPSFHAPRVGEAGGGLICTRRITTRNWVGGKVNTAVAGEPPAPSRSIIEDLCQVLPAERRGILRAYLQDLARQTLGHGEGELIAPDQPLMAQGFDSLMSVDLQNRLSKSLGKVLPAKMLFDYPTLDRLADYLLKKVKIVDDGNLASRVDEDQQQVSAEALLDEINALVIT
jgi:acyl carrier protein